MERRSLQGHQRAFHSILQGRLPQECLLTYMATGHNLGLHFRVDERPFATYFDVHQGYRVLTHSHIPLGVFGSECGVCGQI